MERIAARFGRSELRRRAAAYLRGLLSPIERKNGWQPRKQPATARRMVCRSSCRARGGTPTWCGTTCRPTWSSSSATLTPCWSSTGPAFWKKGKKAAGVARQYSGTAGRIENSQIGVFLGYASRHGRVLLDRALYLPKNLPKDRLRRTEAHIPGDVTFVTKPMLGLAMLERARATGVPFAWITGDSVYGGVYALRQWAEQHRCSYVLTVTSKQHLGLRPVSAWIEDLGEADWQRLSAGDGAKGPRLYDWAYRLYAGSAKGFRCGLLVRGLIADPSEITFYFTHAPEGLTFEVLVKIAGTRWSIESLFEQSKGEVGLDQYEVRSWTGWHRRITFAMLALAYLAAVRKDAIGGGCGPEKPRRGPPAADRSRGQTPHRGRDRQTLPRPPTAVSLVRMASASSAAGQTRPLDTTNQKAA